MPQATRRERALVLKKTKLGEADLILTMLAQDGSQLRAVAKGARKPTSSFASRLEIYAVSDVLLAHGKSLDIVKEARLENGHAAIHSSMERAACAAPIAELLARVSQEGLAVPRLFDLSCATLDELAEADPARCPLVCAAGLWKIMGMAGFRPSLRLCASCGRAVPLEGPGTVSFSLAEGGALCSACARRSDAVRQPVATLRLVDALISSPYSAIRSFEADQSGAFAALQLASQWMQVHASARLKSLGFLFTCGLF